MGDFGAKFNLPSTGIDTVEGNVAGNRAAALSKQRQSQQHQFEKKRHKIKDDAQRGRKSMNDKFDSNAPLSYEEQVFRSKTVGLVTAEQFKKAQEESAELAKKRKQGLLNEDGTAADEVGMTEEENARAEKKKKEGIEIKKEEEKEDAKYFVLC